MGKGRPFRFLNYLADHPDFLNVVEGVWRMEQRGSAMEQVWRKLKCLKGALKSSHVVQFQHIRDTILNCQSELDEIQTLLQDDPLNGDLHVREAEICVKLRKWQSL